MPARKREQLRRHKINIGNSGFFVHFDPNDKAHVTLLKMIRAAAKAVRSKPKKQRAVDSTARGFNAQRMRKPRKPR